MLIQKYLDRTITLDEFVSEEFRSEIAEIYAKAKNGEEQVVQAVKKAMKFISKLSTGTQTINLVEFFKAGNKKQPLFLSDNFKKILKEATSDSKTVEITEMFYQHQSIESIRDNSAMAALNEVVIDLGTAPGRLEARKRLGTLAYFLKQQPNDLLINGYSNVIGWFKTQSGSLFGASADWNSDSQSWLL